jgi:hypothetical protein
MNGLIFVFIINFVEFAIFVCALFYQVAITMDVDVEILVQFDDAFEYTRLLFYGIVGNGEIAHKTIFLKIIRQIFSFIFK